MQYFAVHYTYVSDTELIARHPDIVEKHLERWLASREGYLGV